MISSKLVLTKHPRTHMCIHTHTCIYAYTHAYACARACVSVYVGVCVIQIIFFHYPFLVALLPFYEFYCFISTQSSHSPSPFHCSSKPIPSHSLQILSHIPSIFFHLLSMLCYFV